MLLIIDRKITETTEAVAEASGLSAEPGKELRRLVTIFGKLSKQLTAMERSDKEVADFFQEYLPKHLEARIKIESALDAQYDKLRSRLGQ
jgi:hypothetical protein